MSHITISKSAQLNNSPLVRQFNPSAYSADQSTKRRSGQTQSLTTSWENIEFGDVTSGYVFMSNLDATYTVDLGALEPGSGGSTVQFASIPPGGSPPDFHVPSGVTLQARASGGSSATADLDVEIWSD
jgi:hypothetical protein